MRTEPINATGEEREILYYPDSIVFLRDFNAVTLVLNPTAPSIKSINVEFIVYYNHAQNQRKFNVITDGSTATIDLTYFLQELGSGVTIDYVTAGGTVFYENGSNAPINIIRSESFTTSNGYSLPNRQHYTETSVYTPPFSIYHKAHPQSDDVELEFATNQTAVINGERHEGGDSFMLKAPEEDCKINVEVDIVGGFEAWNKSTTSWTYGCTYFWADHVYFEADSVLGKLLENTGTFSPENNHITNMEDKDAPLGNGYFTCGLFFRASPNTPNEYQLLYMSVIEKTDSMPRWYPIDGNYTIRTDEYDDFMIIDYNDVRGYKKPTYGIYNNNTNEQVQSVDFIFYNGFTPNIRDNHAKGHLVIGLNSPFMPTATSSINDYVLRLLGISRQRMEYDNNVSPYDYTLSDYRDGGVKGIYSLRTLLFGDGSTVGISGNAFWNHLFSDALTYATLHRYDDFNLTLIPRRYQYENNIWVNYGFNLPQYTPVYALWFFLNIDHDWQYPLICKIAGSAAVEPAILPYATKLFDNSISIASVTRGASIIKASFTSYVLDVPYGKLNLVNPSQQVHPSIINDNIVVDGQQVYLYPIPANNGGYLSSAIILKTQVLLSDNSIITVFFDHSGNQLICNESDPYSPTSVAPDLPATFYVSFNDIGGRLLSYSNETQEWTVESSAFSGDITMRLEYRDDSSVNIQYYLFPYNCTIPTTLTNDDVLPKYALMPSQIGNVGKVFDSAGNDLGCGLIVSGCYISPFNVGRTTVFGDVTYQNNPELTGWFSLYNSIVDLSKPIRDILNPDSIIYHNYFDYFQSLYNGREMFYYYDNTWKQTGRGLLTYEGDLSTVVPAPCEVNENTVLDFTKGAVSFYRILLYSLCNTDQVFWLRYENMDGFERWLPFEIKRRVYENTMGDFKYVTPTQSSINAYPMQSPLSLQEKITCFIGDVPQDCYIEDILYSPYLEGWNWDGSVHFQCVLEENEIVRDSSQELEDFVFNFIKKK